MGCSLAPRVPCARSGVGIFRRTRKFSLSTRLDFFRHFESVYLLLPFLGGEVLKLDWGRERGGPFLEEFSLHQSLRFLRRKVVSGGFVGLPAGKDLGVRLDSFLEGGAEFLLRAMPSSFLLSPLSRGGIVFFFFRNVLPELESIPIRWQPARQMR